jgi:hypothetical protein
MKNLLKKQLDWLWSAVKNEDKLQIITVTEDCAMATDGARMHLVNADLAPDTVHDADIGGTLEEFSDASVIVLISINPEFLIDALRVFSDIVDIYYVESENIKGLVINSDESECEAFLMCIEKVNDE